VSVYRTAAIALEGFLVSKDYKRRKNNGRKLCPRGLRFAMCGQPWKARRRQNGDKNNWKGRCVSTMIVMGDRWAAGGSNRLTNSWRVVLHINDDMCAGASEWRMIAPR
jgi:hypothetical protein